MKPLTGVEEVYQVRNRSSQDPLNYPIKLNNKIAALMGVIESADHRPTDQTYEVFKELSALLEKQLQQMNATIKTELPRLNAALKRDKVDAINPDAKPAAPAGRGPSRRSSEESGQHSSCAQSLRLSAASACIPTSDAHWRQQSSRRSRYPHPGSVVGARKQEFFA